MTKEEMMQRIMLVESEARAKKDAIRKEYAESASMFRVGDIVSDGGCTIRVEEISLHGESSIMYYGVMLTKAGKPNARGDKRAVFESCIDLNKVVIK